MLRPVITRAEGAARDAYARALDTGPAASWRAARDRTTTERAETAEHLATSRARAAAELPKHTTAEVRTILTAAGIDPDAVHVQAEPDDDIPGASRVYLLDETAEERVAAALADTHDVWKGRPGTLVVVHLADLAHYYESEGRSAKTVDAARALLAAGTERRHARARAAAEEAAAGVVEADAGRPQVRADQATPGQRVRRPGQRSGPAYAVVVARDAGDGFRTLVRLRNEATGYEKGEALPHGYRFQLLADEPAGATA
jgi:hypothetical protein